MIEHGIKKFVLRQKGFKDTPITFVGDGNKWVALIGPHNYYILPHKFGDDNPTRSDVYGAWAQVATANRLSNKTKRPYVMEVKNG